MRQLTDNGVRCGADRRVAREGSALLQGLALCGRCGRHMKVRYHCDAAGGLRGSYSCRPKEGPCCQVAHGGVVDAAISRIVLETMTPLTLELSLEIHSEVERRFDQAQRLCAQRVERAQYEAERARDRYMQVDPRNRLVAESLEAEWNRCLGRLAEARADLEDSEKKRPDLSDEQRSDILGLAADFPRLWNSRQTPAREKKRLLRLLIDDVTLLRDGEEIEIHVRFRGGASQSLRVQRPAVGSGLRRTEPELVAWIDTLLDDLIATQIAEKLNDEGLQTATGLRFTGASIAAIARNNGLQSRTERLSQRGFLPGRQAARRLGIGYSRLLALAAQGKIQRYPLDSRRAFYDIQPLPSASLSNSNEEGVQCEA